MLGGLVEDVPQQKAWGHEAPAGASHWVAHVRAGAGLVCSVLTST